MPLIYLCIHGFMMAQSNTRRIMTMINGPCQHRCGITFTISVRCFSFRMKSPQLMVRKETSLVTSVKRLIALCRSVPIKWLGYWKDDRPFVAPWRSLGGRHDFVLETLFSRDLQRLHGGATHWKRGLDTHSPRRKIYRPPVRNEQVKYHWRSICKSQREAQRIDRANIKYSSSQHWKVSKFSQVLKNIWYYYYEKIWSEKKTF